MNNNTIHPRATLIAATEMLPSGGNDALAFIGAEGWQTDAETSGEWLAEFAGKLCYSSFSTDLNQNLTRAGTRNNREYLRESILDNGHGSVLEHCVVSFLFSDVSRVVTHEVVRHRAGTAFSQTSGRYVRADVQVWMPSCIEKAGAEAQRLWHESVASSQGYYNRLVQLLGLDDPTIRMPFSKKKELTSALRRILPTGQANNILVTANIRAWRHMIELRTSTGAEEEIRIVFGQVAQQLRDNYPAFFQDMVSADAGGLPVFGFDNKKV